MPHNPSRPNDGMNRCVWTSMKGVELSSWSTVFRISSASRAGACSCAEIIVEEKSGEQNFSPLLLYTARSNLQNRLKQFFPLVNTMDGEHTWISTSFAFFRQPSKPADLPAPANSCIFPSRP